MPVPIDTLIAIVQAGGGFDIDSAEHQPEALIQFIGQMDTTATLRIRNAGAWTQDQLSSVARTAPPGVVEFVF